MIEIYFTKSFLKQVKLFTKDLQEEVLDKVESFKDKNNHISLKVHKLHGKYQEYYSFSVNYKFRIVFRWNSKIEAIFIMIGDHDVYK